MLKVMTLKELATMSGLRLRRLRETLEQGWSPRLLSLAGGVSSAYFRAEIRRKRIPAKKFGHSWVISREWGDTWLREKKNTVIIDGGGGSNV